MLNLKIPLKEFPWRRKWQPTPVFLPGESKDRGAWQATVYGVVRVGHNRATTRLEIMSFKYANRDHDSPKRILKHATFPKFLLAPNNFWFCFYYKYLEPISKKQCPGNFNKQESSTFYFILLFFSLILFFLILFYF